MLGLMPSADITLTSRSVDETRAIARAIAATRAMPPAGLLILHTHGAR